MEPQGFWGSILSALGLDQGLKIQRKEVQTGMRDYELVFIIRPNIDDDGVSRVVEQVTQLVKAGDGAVTSVDVWGRRTLAYPIANHREGIYVLFRTNMPPSALPEMERNLKLSEEIIRYLLVRVES
jgi:small subunit ribosomal protein S6